MLESMCEGIDNAIDIVTQQTDFWSNLNSLVTNQLNAKLVKKNGKVSAALVEESQEEWQKIEVMYNSYASAVSCFCY